MAETYTNPGWNNGTIPALNAENLNAMSNGIVENQEDIGELQTEMDDAQSAIGQLQTGMTDAQDAIEALQTDKVAKADIADDLTTDDANKILSAAQGKKLNDEKAAKADIVDDLTTDNANKMLSAAQGKVLKQLLDDSASPFIHTKTGTVNNFAGTGKLGFAKMTADYADGDTVTVNGGAVTVIGDLTSAITDSNVLFSLTDAAMFVYAISSPFVIPDGNLALPVNDTETWLNCAGLQYAAVGSPSLSQVVANASLCQTLMNSQNATSYLIRSTTIQTAVLGSQTAIAALNASDPFINATMTSNSAPTGYVAAASNSSAYAYAVTSGGWSLNATGWVYVKLPNGVWPYKFELAGYAVNQPDDQWNGTVTYYYQASNDNVNYTNLAGPITTNQNVITTYISQASTTLYQYYRIWVSSINGVTMNVNTAGVLHSFKVYGKLQEV